ncbi:GyrI-like domain-containing protein [Paenibacillus xylanexedens]|uniref:GyrI-like domain-containing protein n=1 Tax=Paenibacillus xylanexedens TaxID=528191 RepID=UPI00119E3F64|nr:GyrI-like domain-containing protein [Paenibacillus xylanexedens]
METKIVTLDAFYVAGYRIEATVEEFEAGLRQSHYDKLIEKKDEIKHRKNDQVLLMQLYPSHEDFDAKVHPFTHVLCYEVNEPEGAPPEMIIHHVPARTYVTCTHRGLETDIGDTYDYIYGQWLDDAGHVPECYDFEIWDERYQPESADNEIDIYVALQS